MSELHARCLDAFPEWLKSLANDATELARILEDPAIPETTRLHVASALNYLFKSLDLIPDGIEDLGFLDDAFVLRVAAHLALGKVEGDGAPPFVGELASQTGLIRELLGDDYVRLSSYVDNLLHGAARGRTTDEIVEDAEIRSTFVQELQAWASDYQPPAFARDEKNIVKLTSFLSAKLPS